MSIVDEPQYQDREGRFSQVRHNMLTGLGYTPYCAGSHLVRAVFDGQQMKCFCGWRSNFEPEFIERYKAAQASLSKAQRTGARSDE